jgi:hypothetical protein
MVFCSRLNTSCNLNLFRFCAELLKELNVPKSNNVLAVDDDGKSIMDQLVELPRQASASRSEEGGGADPAAYHPAHTDGDRFSAGRSSP